MHINLKKAKLLALSSTEAEYLALFEASKTIMWLRQFLSELGYPPSTPTIIYEDNKSAINIIQNGNDKGRTKHMDIRYHYIRELVQYLSHISPQFSNDRRYFNQTSGFKTFPRSSHIFVRQLSLRGGVDLRCNYMLQTKLYFKLYLILLYLYYINLIYNINIVNDLYLHIF